jgi:hypothetical protein
MYFASFAVFKFSFEQRKNSITGKDVEILATLNILQLTKENGGILH